MVNYWKSKVLPKIKKVMFGAADSKTRLAAAEANKSFDESKEAITKELEDKKAEIGPKVIEIYQNSAEEMKLLVKKPTPSGLKVKDSTGLAKFFEELVKIDFPGAKTVSENLTKFSPVLIADSVVFILEKAAAFLPADEPAPADVTATTITEAAETREINVEEVKKELMITEEKKEEIPPQPTAAVVAEAAKPAVSPAPPAVAAEAAKPAETTPAPAKTAESAPAPASTKAAEPAPAKAAEPAPAKAPEPAKTAATKGK